MESETVLRGKLIVFEGIDRSGKSTQINLLSQKLSEENIKNEVLSFPYKTTPTGKLLREYLRNRDESIPKQALHLLFSANRWEVMNRIIKLLKSGTHVITDRYAFSGIAYSVGAEVRLLFYQVFPQGLDFNWCLIPDTGIVEPDVVFYMDLAPECSSARGNFGSEIYENLEHMENVYEVFKRFGNLSYWNIIKAHDDQKQIHHKIYSIAKKCQFF
ncbi:thymidylate kinase, putative [Theileria annulata]|uniref:dTMP kinase n=1 Tax=Theileria annulata TaxID=5874 RepID=Q4UE21_THEAN|nr:thymidylate kinase, putative [Theileria annulata]CAI74668.1 thymidylate kinase, putative [Theileria annulata]|eukprot:XP_952400.1 thymidylate kinase, putative [Theileria annulata]